MDCGKPAALVEIDHRNAVRRAINEVSRDQRALEGKFRIERRFAGAQALVGLRDHVGGRIGADGRKGAIGNAIVGNRDAARPEQVDAIALLPGASELCRNAFKPVAGNDSVVFTHRPAVHQNAAIGAISHLIVLDGKPGGIDAVQTSNSGRA